MVVMGGILEVEVINEEAGNSFSWFSKTNRNRDSSPKLLVRRDEDHSEAAGSLFHRFAPHGAATVTG